MEHSTDRDRLRVAAKEEADRLLSRFEPNDKTAALAVARNVLATVLMDRYDIARGLSTIIARSGLTMSDDLAAKCEAASLPYGDERSRLARRLRKAPSLDGTLFGIEGAVAIPPELRDSLLQFFGAVRFDVAYGPPDQVIYDESGCSAGAGASPKVDYCERCDLPAPEHCSSICIQPDCPHKDGRKAV